MAFKIGSYQRLHGISFLIIKEYPMDKTLSERYLLGYHQSTKTANVMEMSTLAGPPILLVVQLVSMD